MITKDKGNKKHILAIEDDIAVAKMLELLLVDYNLTILDSAEIALGYLKENPGAIDLILLDNMLPGMS